MNTHVHIPGATHLQLYVTAIWETQGTRNVNEVILPQGVLEMVFNLADPMQGALGGNPVHTLAPRCFAQGINTHVVNVSYSGMQHLFGVRLQPHMVQPLLGIEVAELRDVLIDLTLISPRFNTLWHQLVEATSFEERVKLVEAALPVLPEIDCDRTSTLSNLFLSDDISDFLSVDDLSQKVFYSSRHLNRKVQSLFGLTAEEMILYKKFLHAVKLMHVPALSLTNIAYQSGFYDQAHFCRIFKKYAGITPKQYQLNKSTLPFHLFS